MSAVFVMFPPGAGGNHIKNLICLDESFYNSTTDFTKKFYTPDHQTVHIVPGFNFKSELLPVAAHADKKVVLHGHFAELATYRNDIIEIKDKKIILIAVEDPLDTEILNQRREKLEYGAWDGYSASEQFFLYQPTMSQCYFGVDIKDICCIKLSELWQSDLASFDIIDRLNYFLGTQIDRDQAQRYHSLWYATNFSS